MLSKPSPELHIFPLGGHSDEFVVFHPVTKLFFKANRPTAEVLGRLSKGEPMQDISSDSGLPLSGIEGLKERLEEALAPRLEKMQALEERAVGGNGKRVCGKISFHVSNDCNMRCTYCYAMGGNYGLQRGHMSPETARRILDRFYAHFDEVEQLMFFGGEPLLNFPAIEAVCSYLEERSRSTGTPMPDLGIVTNLSAIPKGFPELVNRHGISVTVSLDGPASIHDATRPFMSGAGSYKVVKRNIRRLKKLTGQPSMIEATVTRQHLESGIRPQDLSKFFAREFGIFNAEIVDASVAPDHPNAIPRKAKRDMKREQNASLEDLLDQLTRTPHVAGANALPAALGLLLHQGPEFKVHCNAGIRQYAVSTTGDLYPCHMFVGELPFRMGNVFDEGAFASGPLNAIRTRLLERAKTETRCSTCWARNLCIGCVARAYYETGAPDVAAQADCGRIRHSMERLIAKLAEINSSPQLWQSFLANFKTRIDLSRDTQCPDKVVEIP